MASTADTVRGLRWIIIGFLIALAEACIALAISLAFWISAGFGLDLAERAALGYASIAIPAAALIVGALSVPTLRRGRNELGSAHAAAMDNAFRALLFAGASAVAFLVLSLVVSFIPLRNPTNPLDTTLTETVVLDARILASITLAGSLGMFLFWTIRDLGTSETTFLAGAALALGVVSALQSVFQGGFDFPAGVLNVTSLLLWLMSYATAWFRVSRDLPDSGAESVSV